MEAAAMIPKLPNDAIEIVFGFLSGCERLCLPPADNLEHPVFAGAQ